MLRAGLIAVNVNPLYTARELEHQLKDSGAEAVIVLENFADLQQAIGNTRSSTSSWPRWAIFWAFQGSDRELRRAHDAQDVPAFRCRPHQVQCAVSAGRSMAFARPTWARRRGGAANTGGTTGVAKGATLLHHTIVATCSPEAWMQPGLKRKPLIGQITIVCALPLYHVFAFITCGLLGMRTGALNILIPNPRDMKGTIAELAKYHMNIFPGVNTLFNGLANQPDFAKLDFSGLVISNGGGMAVQEAVAKKWLAITGCPIVEGYGSARPRPASTCKPHRLGAYTGTIGLPLPNVEIRSSTPGKEVAWARPARSPSRARRSMQSYWPRPDETALVMTPTVLQVGRRRRDGCEGLHQDRGSQEGHDRGLRLQGLPQRDRGRVASHPLFWNAPPSACPMRAPARRSCVRGEEGSRAHQGRFSRGAPSSHRLQAAQVTSSSADELPRPMSQDPAARIARQHC